MDAFEEQHQLNRDFHARGKSPETPTEVPPISTTKKPSASTTETVPAGNLPTNVSSCSATSTKEITIHTSVPSTKGSLCSTEAVPTSTITLQLPSCSAPCTEETTIVVGPTVESSLTLTEKPPASTKTSVQAAPTQEVPTTLCSFVSNTSKSETGKTTVAWSVSSTTSQHANTETGSPTHSSPASTIETTLVTTTAHGPSATEAHANSASRSGHLIFHLFILGLFLVLFDAL
ncbi:uncharacterized protein N7459_001022 [Penicillium hispanicum]|uniref:uncharacterized protein n=1 Tax=Penicillium hispanicum TaxID=1080232 RepID=UPI002540692E|nr:uncharacterized protein N7459_001022 [Penicillium hispanicum]KAJ5594814.1 hypothetical protein N7459_001022 [Penicillium hispanicum]